MCPTTCGTNRLIRDHGGNVVQYAHVERHIEQLGTRFDIREIAFDRWGAVQMSQNLDDAGFTVVPSGKASKT
ncbi:phage terminase large subunit [Cutibacterium acnes JCM 18918]|nr:phage terminase large subunit [Cutibacterium acnes JCM 18918]